jgi:hypothetical protein
MGQRCSKADERPPSARPRRLRSREAMSLGAFIELCNNHPERLAGRTLQIDGSSGDFSTLPINITSPCCLRFDPTQALHIGEISVTHCRVEISGLFLFGHICFRSAQAKVEQCKFRWVDSGHENLLEAWDDSRLTMAGCSFIGHRDFGIILEKNTFMTLSRCEIGQCELAGVGIFGGGIECNDCHFFESGDNFLVSILENGKGAFRNCTFEKAGDAGLKVDTSPQVVIEHCTFSQCKRGFHGIKVTDCRIEDTHFSGSEFSSIVLKSSHCVVRKVTFKNVIGNGIWAADPLT